MSNWIALTPADLPTAKVAALVNALQTAALGEGQVDPSLETIVNVTRRIRAEVKGCQKNYIDADVTKIPSDLKSLAVRMVLRDLKNRLEIPLTDDERKSWTSDERYLERIASCEVPIDMPDNPVVGETQAVTGAPLIIRKRLRFRRREQEGL
jgi:hypothetical protein